MKRAGKFPALQFHQTQSDYKRRSDISRLFPVYPVFFSQVITSRFSWRNFFRYLKQRVLQQVRLIVSDKSVGILEAEGDFFPESRWQRCVVHFYRNVLNAVPTVKLKVVSAMLKAIHAQEYKKADQQKAKQGCANLKELRLEKAARIVQVGAEEIFSFYELPFSHWRHIRTNDPLKRLNREIHRRTRVVRNFPDGIPPLCW